MSDNSTQVLPAKTDYITLLGEVKGQIQKLFTEYHTENYVFHTFQQTEFVVSAAEEIANHYQLNDEDFFIVMTSAWFLEVGYLIDPEDPKSESYREAKNFLKKRGLSKKIIKAVKGCIMAAEVPQSPETLLERIVCDASLYNWGAGDFEKNNELLYEEINLISGEDISFSEWIAFTIEEIRRHRFKTDYGRLLLKDRKEEILKDLLKKGKEIGLTKKQMKKAKDQSGKKEKGKEGKKEKEEKEKAKISRKKGKSIDTMLKIASNSNQRLAKLADYKARNMITVNSIILSVVVGFLLRELDAYSYLAIPTYLLLLVCVLTLMFAILATRPDLTTGVFEPKDVKKEKVDLLYFGDFYKMSAETYKNTMWEVMDDHELLYNIIIQDIYAQGAVLGKKFKLLRLSYNIFMYGLILSVLAYIVATVI